MLDLLNEYDRLVAESYKLAGHSNSHGRGKTASHRERQEHNLKVQAVRKEILAEHDASTAIQDLLLAEAGALRTQVADLLAERVCSTCDRTRNDPEAVFCSNVFHVTEQPPSDGLADVRSFLEQIAHRSYTAGWATDNAKKLLAALSRPHEATVERCAQVAETEARECTTGTIEHSIAWEIVHKIRAIRGQEHD